MGEAKRRKEAGWVPRMMRLECFIAQSQTSDAHSVYLGISRGEGVQLRQGNSFARIESAWEDLCRDKKVLKTFKYRNSQSNDEIAQAFWCHALNTFGDVHSDDFKYELWGDKRAGLEWIKQGGRPYWDEPPAGVRIKIINPPVQKNYKVLLIRDNLGEKEHIKSLCGNPEDTHVFTVSNKTFDELVEDAKQQIHLYSSYVSAAYAADYLNSNNLNLDYLLNEKNTQRLLYESNRLQGKL